jgi:FHS family L-fucose permease-like MFS transporter
LETVANPYTTLLGPADKAASRINLAQTFNALGWIMGPLIGSVLIFKNDSNQSILELFIEALKKVFLGLKGVADSLPLENIKSHTENSALIAPYVGLGGLVLLVLVMFAFAKLPEVNTTPASNDYDSSEGISSPKNIPLFKQRHFVLAVVAQFLYVAAQTGIGSFFINYTIEVKEMQLSEIQGGLLLGLGGMLLFAVGRLSGSMIMKKMKAGTLLGFCALANTILMLVVTQVHNRFGVMALIGSYLFMSIMFPSIFALGLTGLGEKTKTAASILILTIVGGAIAPAFMGWIGAEKMNLGFIIPLVCFLYISYYGFVGSKVINQCENQQITNS